MITGSRSFGSAWKRCWCVVRDGTLSVFRLGSTGDGQLRWREKPLAVMQLVLCNIKPVKLGSRFYLELRSPVEQLQLLFIQGQAEGLLERVAYVALVDAPRVALVELLEKLRHTHALHSICFICYPIQFKFIRYTLARQNGSSKQDDHL